MFIYVLGSDAGEVRPLQAVAQMAYGFGAVGLPSALPIP